MFPRSLKLSRRMSSPQLTSLIEEAFPGARIIRTQRLRGGISAHMLAVTVEHANGRRQQVSVRRLRRDSGSEPGRIEYEYGVLGLLERVGVSAPRPLHLDAAGKHFGDPALVMTFLPGKTNVAPTDVPSWTDALAGALRNVHTVTPEAADLSMLKPQDNRVRIGDIATENRGDSFVGEVVSVLRRHCDSIEPMPPTLIHNDYWGGNTIWNRGRLTGIIDWTHARIGDPRNDVSECRSALTIDHDEDTADRFLADYESHAGRSLPDMWFFDLLRGVTAYMYHEFYLEGMADLGLHLDQRTVKRQLLHLLRNALDASRAFE
jgi:aminoglycoside phosphotransferase (APT) family kinase protein